MAINGYPYGEGWPEKNSPRQKFLEVAWDAVHAPQGTPIIVFSTVVDRLEDGEWKRVEGDNGWSVIGQGNVLEAARALRDRHDPIYWNPEVGQFESQARIEGVEGVPVWWNTAELYGFDAQTVEQLKGDDSETGQVIRSWHTANLYGFDGRAVERIKARTAGIEAGPAR